MCMQFTITKRDIAAIAVVAVLLSPFIIVGGVIGAIPYYSYHAAKEVRYHRRQKKLEKKELLEFEQELAKKRAGALTAEEQHSQLQQQLTNNSPFKAADFHNALQHLCENASKYKSYETFLELAMGLYILGDHFGAEPHFEKALNYSDGHFLGARSTASRYALAVGLYFYGLNKQLLRRFPDSVKLLEEAHALLLLEQQQGGHDASSSSSLAMKKSAYSEGTFDPNLHRIELADVEAQLAYSFYLQAVYDDETCTNSEFATDLLNQAVSMGSASLLSRPTNNTRAEMVLAFSYYRLSFTMKGRVVIVPNDNNEEPPLPLEINQEILEQHVLPLCESVIAANDGELSPAEATMLKAWVLCALGDWEKAETAWNSAKSFFDEGATTLPANPLEVTAQCRVENRQMEPGYQMNSYLCRWPLPPTIVEEGDALGHQFVEHHFKSPTWCDYCMSFIKHANNGRRCSNCKYECHEECLDGAILLPCLKKAEAVDLHKAVLKNSTGDEPAAPSSPHLAHHHQLHPRRVHRCHNCSHCNSFIMMMTNAYQCSVCNLFFHEGCGKALPQAMVLNS